MRFVVGLGKPRAAVVRVRCGSPSCDQLHSHCLQRGAWEVTESMQRAWSRHNRRRCRDAGREVNELGRSYRFFLQPAGSPWCQRRSPCRLGE